MTKLKNIAEKCGVSISTVSTAINHPHKISPQVREKILDEIKRTGYKIKKDKIKKIGLICNHFENYYFGDFYNEVIFGIMQEAMNQQIDIRILESPITDHSLIHEVNGVIFIGRSYKEDIEKIRKFNIPLVLAGHPNSETPNLPTIYFNRVQNTELLTTFLQNCGHSNIGVIYGETDPNDVIGNEFLDTIKKNLPDIKEDNIFKVNIHEIQTVEITWNKILSKIPKITALMCFSDLIAYYIYKCAQKYNVSIPEDISITGYDGLNIPRYLCTPNPSLTTVYCEKKELGIRSVNYLCKLIMNETKEKTIQLHGNLVIGDSICRIK